jgi:hypothetical protein
MNVKKILTEALNLTEKEFSTLADYAYCDMMRTDQTVEQWQRERLEGMMEEEGIEQELGEPLWEPGDKDICINIFYRQVNK